jgi:hypothetical protein
MSQKTTKEENEGKAPIVCTYGDCKELQAGDGEYCEKHFISNRKEIKYYSVRIYGTDMKYIKDPEQAKYIFILTGRKTLTSNDVIALDGLGFNFTEVLK